MLKDRTWTRHSFVYHLRLLYTRAGLLLALQVRAEVFTGGFPELGPAVLPSARPDHQLSAALEAARNVLAGTARFHLAAQFSS